MTKWSFEVPAGARFTCSQCGDCCRNLFVLLGPGERERLAGLDWSGRAEDLDGAKTLVRTSDPAFRGRFRLARKDDGACVYLGDRMQCRIHEHFGPEAKPLTCRLYPFGFRAVGERIGVDVAFSCRAVSEGSGAPVAERVEEWMRELAERAAPTAPPIKLRDGHRVTPDVLWEIEHYLLGFLANTALSVPDRVRCALDWLELATTGDPSTPAAATMRRTMAEALPRRILSASPAGPMDETQRAVFRQWLFLAINPVGGAFHDLAPAQRDREIARRRQAAIAFRDAEGRPWIDNEEIAATFDDVDAVDPGPLRNGPESVAAFLSAKIVGQRFLAAGMDELAVVDGARILFLCHPMIAWTAKALAAARRAARVESSDVREATRLVDRTLGQITTGLLQKKQAQAFEWVMQETDLVASAMRDVIERAGSGAQLRGA